MDDTKINATKQNPAWFLLFFVWIFAISGTLISLFFSEIMQFPVCILCWYQRIALYPLAVMIPFSLFPFDMKIIRYITPLIMLGWLTALFHVLVVIEVIPKAAQPCVQGIPCSDIHINLLGFINIPIMSLITFSLMAASLFMVKRLYISA